MKTIVPIRHRSNRPKISATCYRELNEPLSGAVEMNAKQRRWTITRCWLILFMSCATLQARAQTGGLLKLRAPAINLGGWADEVVFRGWRIQRHAVIGHYRLADAQGRRQAFGSYETCLAALEKAKQDIPLKPLPKHVVLVLHGLGTTPWFMQGMADYLTDKGSLHVENIGYASTLEDFGAYAKSLESVIRHLEGVEKIDFVAHSMGNIVIRRYLGGLTRLSQEKRPPITFGRFVMISPPNHGAEVVDLLTEMVADHDVIRSAAELMAGESAKQLAPHGGWPDLEKTLVVPDFEFAVIAGGRGDDRGYLSQLPGDDDSLLTVETMKLVGATDFIQVKGIHQLMPTLKEVQELTLNFLILGYFRSLEQRQPTR